MPAGANDVRVKVSHFTFVGNGALSSEMLSAAVAQWAGKALTFGELIQAVEAIEARYKAEGYLLAQAYLPPQKIREGAIEITISEGRLGETRLEGENRVSPEVLYAYLDRLPKDVALKLPVLERQILLINELAGGQTTLDLQAGENPGTTDIVLVQKPDHLFSGKADANNHGSPSTGIRRLSINATANSLLGLGERISALAMTSDTRNLTSYNLRGEFPVGGNGWRLTAAASRAEYSLGGSFASLQASGTADSLRFGAAYPIVRSRTSNLKAQVEADESRLKDQFLASNTFLDKKSRGITATLSGDAIDETLGGGSSRADLALRAGHLALGTTAAAQDAPPTGPGVAGGFRKVTLNAQRQQVLGKEFTLQLQLAWQLAGGKNLDSSEKMSLGGPTSIPGYASGEASGDAGAHLKAGIRWQRTPEFALTVFADHGNLRLANKPVAGTTNNTKRLADLGLGADWILAKNYSINAILAWATGEAPNPNDNARPRLWLSLGYTW